MKSKTYPFKKALFPQLADANNDTLLLKNGRNKGSGLDNVTTKIPFGIGKKIMIADDDPAIIDVVRLMLETAGYQIYTTANSNTFADINTIKPDLVLLDILMSGINGYNICRLLKSQVSTKHIPVIIISASRDARKIALEANADDYIAKPFEMYMLLQKVARYIMS